MEIVRFGQKYVDMWTEPLYRFEWELLNLAVYGIFAMEVIESVIFDWGGVLIEDPAPGLVKYCSEALGVSKEDYAKVYDKFGGDFQKGFL